MTEWIFTERTLISELRFSNFLKFVAFSEEHIRCDAIILDKIVLFSTKAKFMFLFVPVNVFDTSCD